MAHAKKDKKEQRTLKPGKKLAAQKPLTTAPKEFFPVRIDNCTIGGY